MYDGPDPPSFRQQQQALNRLVSLSGFGFVAPISKAAANMSLHAKDMTKFLNSIALNSFDAVIDKSATKDGNGQMYSTKVSVENGEVLIVMEFPKDQVFVWVTRKNPRAVRELGKAFRVSLNHLPHTIVYYICLLTLVPFSPSGWFWPLVRTPPSPLPRAPEDRLGPW